MKTSLISRLAVSTFLAACAISTSIAFAASPVVKYKTFGNYAYTGVYNSDDTGCKFSDANVSISEFREVANKTSQPGGSVYFNEANYCDETGKNYYRWGYADLTNANIALNKNLTQATVVGDVYFEIFEVNSHIDDEGNYLEETTVSGETIHVDVTWTGEGKPERYSDRYSSHSGKSMVRWNYKGLSRNSSVNGVISGETLNMLFDSSNPNSYTGLGSATSGYFEIRR